MELLNQLVNEIRQEMIKQKVSMVDFSKMLGLSRQATYNKFNNPKSFKLWEVIIILEHLNLINPLYYKGGE